MRQSKRHGRLPANWADSILYPIRESTDCNEPLQVLSGASSVVPDLDYVMNGGAWGFGYSADARVEVMRVRMLP